MDNEFFTVREENGLRLIIPAHHAAVGNAAWNPHNLWRRSRVETLDCRVVSQGFGKFFNLGHGPEGLQITLDDVARACARGDALATLKVDGSLLIRSVHKDAVITRTRGSFSAEHLENAHELDKFRAEYPKVFDAHAYPNFSLLFEWVSPLNTIVMRYPYADITLIGAVDHTTMTYLPMDRLRGIAVALDVPIVKHWPLTIKGWDELYATLDSDRDIEGYVIRLNNEQDLVKVKCAPYLTRHALKSNLTTEGLAEMYFQYGRPSFQGFLDQFAKEYDEETATWAMPVIASLYDGVKHLIAIENHIRQSVEKRKAWTRKDVAIAFQNEYGQTKKFALAMNIWLNLSDVRSNPLRKSILLQNTKQTERSMFSTPEREDDDA